MLRYLAAQPVPPKEYGIGVEVFDRGPAFDPRTDNIVRVQARNLRARLQEYYLGEGAQDRSRIELPKGSYALQSRPVTVARPHSFHKTMAVAALLAAVAVLFGLWLYLRFNATFRPHVVAVLPFTNLDQDGSTNYFSDGLAEEIITDLSRLDRLGVIGRSSSFRFRASSLTTREIGDQLGATEILEGSVRSAGVMRRVTARLLDARTGKSIWSGEFDRTPADLLRTEDEIASVIAASLKLRLRPMPSANENTRSGDAYDAYLRGRYYWAQSDARGALRAIEMFQQSITADPTFAPAYAGLASAYGLTQVTGVAAPLETWPKMETMLHKSLSLDETNADAHTLMAGVQAWYHWNYRLGEVEFRRGIALAPSGVIQHQYFASYLGAFGRSDEAEAEIARAIQLDPLNAFARWAKAQILYWKGDDKAAIPILQKLQADEPGLPFLYYLLPQALSHSGRNAEAISILERYFAESPENLAALGVLGYCYAKAGRPGDARAILARLEDLSHSRFVPSFARAYVLLGLEDRTHAFDAVLQSIEERSLRPPWVIADPIFRDLRGDPRWPSLLARCHL